MFQHGTSLVIIIIIAVNIIIIIIIIFVIIIVILIMISSIISIVISIIVSIIIVSIIISSIFPRLNNLNTDILPVTLIPLNGHVGLRNVSPSLSNKRFRIYQMAE